MSDIVHSHAERVEKKRRVLRRRYPEEDICSEEYPDATDHSYLPPKVFALPWHDDVSHIMHMLPCSAYF